MSSFDERYFMWLYNQAIDESHRSPGYKTVCKLMHEVVFNDSVPNDDNRSADGIDLRYEFADGLAGGVELAAINHGREFLDKDATVFEVLVALSRRCDFQIKKTPAKWFYIFLKNLTLDLAHDESITAQSSAPIRRIIRNFNDRRYSPKGQMSIFPMRHPPSDMRDIELWYQMSAYIIEKHML